MTRKKIFILALLGVFLRTTSAKADATKDFVMSCTYGVLAGTLVGTATLAFADKPGDNLNRIARGASLGLYAGILLGLYVINLGGGEEETSAAYPPKFQVYPLVTAAHGVEGGGVSYSLLNF